MRRQFKVSTKAAIFNHDKTKVLVIHMNKINDYGLPGGHIDEGEDIESTMRRELAEECGITEIELKKVDFFMHSNGKIILAFVGLVTSDNEDLVSKQSEQEGIPRWITKGEVETLSIEPNYKKLVINNW